jgi:hypothetical protein
MLDLRYSFVVAVLHDILLPSLVLFMRILGGVLSLFSLRACSVPSPAPFKS